MKLLLSLSFIVAVFAATCSGIVFERRAPLFGVPRYVFASPSNVSWVNHSVLTVLSSLFVIGAEQRKKKVRVKSEWMITRLPSKDFSRQSRMRCMPWRRQHMLWNMRLKTKSRLSSTKFLITKRKKKTIPRRIKRRKLSR